MTYTHSVTGETEIVFSSAGVQQGCNFEPFCHRASALELFRAFRDDPPVAEAQILAYMNDLVVLLPLEQAQNPGAVEAVARCLQLRTEPLGVVLNRSKSRGLPPPPSSNGCRAVGRWRQSNSGAHPVNCDILWPQECWHTGGRGQLHHKRGSGNCSWGAVPFAPRRKLAQMENSQAASRFSVSRPPRDSTSSRELSCLSSSKQRLRNMTRWLDEPWRRYRITGFKIKLASP